MKLSEYRQKLESWDRLIERRRNDLNDAESFREKLVRNTEIDEIEQGHNEIHKILKDTRWKRSGRGWYKGYAGIKFNMNTGLWDVYGDTGREGRLFGVDAETAATFALGRYGK